jgi:hypothetical protein
LWGRHARPEARAPVTESSGRYTTRQTCPAEKYTPRHATAGEGQVRECATPRGLAITATYLVLVVGPVLLVVGPVLRVLVQGHLQAVEHGAGAGGEEGRVEAGAAGDGHGRPPVDGVVAVDEREALHVVERRVGGPRHQPLRVRRVVREARVHHARPPHLQPDGRTEENGKQRQTSLVPRASCVMSGLLRLRAHSPPWAPCGAGCGRA